MRLPPWASFYQRSTYAELPVADLPNLPRELNPYERFWVRFAFADLKVLAIAAVSVPLVALCWLAESHFWAFLVLAVSPIAALIAYLLGRHR